MKYTFKSQEAQNEGNDNSKSWIRQKEELLRIHSNVEIVQNPDISFRSDSQLKAGKYRDAKLNKLVDENEISKVFTGILSKTEKLIAKNFKINTNIEKIATKNQKFKFFSQESTVKSSTVKSTNGMGKVNISKIQNEGLSNLNKKSDSPLVDDTKIQSPTGKSTHESALNLDKKSDYAMTDNAKYLKSTGKNSNGVEKANFFQNESASNLDKKFDSQVVNDTHSFNSKSGNGSKNVNLSKLHNESALKCLMADSVENQISGNIAKTVSNSVVVDQDKNESALNFSDSTEEKNSLVKSNDGLEKVDFSKDKKSDSPVVDNTKMETSIFPENGTLVDESTLMKLQNGIKYGINFDELFRMLIEVIADHHDINKIKLEQCLPFQSLKDHEKKILLSSLAKFNDSEMHQLSDIKSVIKALLSYINDENITFIVLSNYLQMVYRRDHAEILILSLKKKEIDIETLFQNI